MTPDPVFGQLARFTPAPPALDRDDLLFRSGRASARAGRWKAAVAVLALTQAASLGLWLTVPHPSSAPPPGPAAAPELSPPDSAAPSEPLGPESYGVLTRRWGAGDLPAVPPAPAAAPDGPELSAAAGRRGEMAE
jgi:hypothetical protein